MMYIYMYTRVYKYNRKYMIKYPVFPIIQYHIKYNIFRIGYFMTLKGNVEEKCPCNSA